MTVGQLSNAERAEVLRAQIESTTMECEALIDSVAWPLKLATENLQKISKKDLTEIKGYTNPPVDVKMLCEAVIIVAGKPKPEWATVKKDFGNANFVEKLISVSRNDKDKLPVSRMKKLAEYTKKKPTFTPDYMVKKSIACKLLCEWVLCIENYHRVAEQVKPRLTRMEDIKLVYMTLKEDIPAQ